MLLTRELDEVIRRCEIAGIRTGVATMQRLRPEIGAEAIEIAGGLVAFSGAESPLSQAVGVAAAAPIARDEVECIIKFYQTRGTAPRVFVTPLSHPTLGRELAAAGFAPCEYESVLASNEFERHARVDARSGVAADLHEWSRASAEAFVHPAALKPGDELIALTIASSLGVLPLEMREDGAIVATAAMDVRDGCAGLFAGSVVANFRGGGRHCALIRDRIARARDAGARFMRATARPASASERNFVRCGFTTLYTRALWERKLDV